MSDPETLSVYAHSAGEYADKLAAKPGPGEAPAFAAFTEGLPEGGRILDLGCGPGQWAAAFRDAGFVVDAVDASPEMAAEAATRYRITVRVELSEALTADGVYDGIWANFSLLHASRADFADHLTRVRRALKSEGLFHIGTKLGEGEGRDRLGRFYSYYGERELLDLLKNAGFTVIQSRTGEGAGLSGSVDRYIMVTAHA